MSTSNTRPETVRMALRLYNSTAWGNWFESKDIPTVAICSSGMKEEVVLPLSIREIDLVFTKKKYQASFELNYGSVEKVHPQLTHSARGVALAMYLRGYRYVHIEY